MMMIVIVKPKESNAIYKAIKSNPNFSVANWPVLYV